MAKQDKPIRNWSDYNKALVRRGSVSLWMNEEVLSEWRAVERSGQQGRPKSYSDLAIQCVLTLQAVFHLPLRAVQGFVDSLFALLKLQLTSPDYTTLSRRRKTLEIELPHCSQKEPIHIVIDSTGLKIYGEGEWKVRQHGYNKRRTWRKLHLGINPANHMIEASMLTTNDFKDNELMDDLLDQIPSKLLSVCADGAYDAKNCYQAIDQRQAKANIPPRRGARISKHPSNRLRNHNLRAIRKFGRKQWKKISGYHQRSLSETGMYRFKKIFGDTLSSRSFDNQAIESLIKCNALNTFSALGMPAY